MSKPVAVILLNWNTPDYTAACITSIKKYCKEELFDIILADNGSTDNSLSILHQQFDDVIFIDNKENLGFAGGNNRALEYSIENRYTYSLLINTDTLVDEDIVAKLYAHLNQYPNAAAVQPAVRWMHEPEKLWNGEGKFNPVLGKIWSDNKLTATHPIYKNAKWATGCCMLLRNSALVRCGLLNELFFLYYEDVELTYRLRDNGHEVHYLPSCKMYHEAGASAKARAPKKEGFLNPSIHYYVSRNHIWFLRKYGNPLFYPINLLFYGFYYAAVWLYFKVRRRKQKADFLIKGLRDGLFTPKSIIWPK
ncbi:glycosyltransferase family 2 protein [Mucilaginibacter auburnensis]|uniref:Glycosyltransferase 2-like domain-containing protein n=1 Tax=Mucilaginibacter auburnensis TaxID=1457233 RepID=A0A2H9VTD1_9SPHI|nr:glycosyltransferase family 2 protein [Mucilaginibacter auburnensis]PJJ84080.1 hypothetical protein CLV57_1084 [Mucilaginibacter auburnensis]